MTAGKPKEKKRQVVDNKLNIRAALVDRFLKGLGTMKICKWYSKYAPTEKNQSD